MEEEAGWLRAGPGEWNLKKNFCLAVLGLGCGMWDLVP